MRAGKIAVEDDKKLAPNCPRGNRGKKETVLCTMEGVDGPLAL